MRNFLILLNIFASFQAISVSLTLSIAIQKIIHEFDRKGLESFDFIICGTKDEEMNGNGPGKEIIRKTSSTAQPISSVS